MYYCPNCKKKFRNYRRRCPNCGSRCYEGTDRRVIVLSIVVGALFLALLCVLLSRGCGPTPPPADTQNSSSVQTDPSTEATQPSATETQPTETHPSETTLPETQPTETTPPETTLPPTQPTTPTESTSPIYTGTYTREELEALDNTPSGYGPGPNLASHNNRPEYAMGEQKRYEKYGANFIAPDNGNIYLTFDCGYEYYITDDNGNKVPLTDSILDTLKEKNVKAVFFVTMDYCKKQPEQVRRMIDEGHAIGNHSNTHPVMPSLTIDEMIYEVTSLHDYVLEHFGYEMHLFRPPTGEFSIRSLAVVHSLGYKNVHWSFAYADYTPENQPDVKKSLDNVLKKAHSGAIYLLHAVSETNAALLGDAIDGFRAQGFNLELFS